MWHRCHRAGGTRNSPGRRFLTPLPILPARTRHILSLSHSPPKLLAFSPSLWGLKWWDTAGTGVSCGYWERNSASKMHHARLKQGALDTLAIIAINICPPLCTYIK